MTIPMTLTYRRLLLPALLLSFVIYLIAVSSFPVMIHMGQGYDDALFIRLGRNIASGQWLGPYNEVTLFKGPMYPVFLAGFSLTGIPFNIAQHCIYFFACLYLANVISRSCNSSTIGIVFFVIALCCPTYYSITRVIREPLYTALTLFLVGCWIDLFLLGRPNQHRVVFSACVGVLFTVYYLTREEGIWILPSLAIIALGSLAVLDPAASTISTRSWRLCSRLLVVALFASLTAGGIGLLNRAFYGRFVIIEMSDADFQKAMAALQRVGAPYERPYLPLPREARQLLYAESPLFATLKSVLDPSESENPWNNGVCRILPSTCGDIGGGWFMWALRDAAGKVGMHETPQKAAVFYRTLASEVGSVCETARLGCAPWLPALLPAIPSSQWEKLPGAFLKAVSLPLFWPPRSPIPRRLPVSDLASPDGPEALEFLNRPYHVLADTDAPPQTKALIRAASLQVLQAAVKIYALVTAAGILAFLVAVGFWPRRLMRDPIFIIVAALIVAVLARSFLLALIHISSFPAIYHERTLPAAPLAICAALCPSVCSSLSPGRLGFTVPPAPEHPPKLPDPENMLRVLSNPSCVRGNSPSAHGGTTVCCRAARSRNSSRASIHARSR